MAEIDSRQKEIAGFLGRYGLDGLSPEELAAFTAMAERVRTQTASVTRMPEKTDEPAHIFRVPAER